MITCAHREVSRNLSKLLFFLYGRHHLVRFKDCNLPATVIGSTVYALPQIEGLACSLVSIDTAVASVDFDYIWFSWRWFFIHHILLPLLGWVHGAVIADVLQCLLIAIDLDQVADPFPLSCSIFFELVFEYAASLLLRLVIVSLCSDLHATIVRVDIELFGGEKLKDLGGTPADALFLQTLMPAHRATTLSIAHWFLGLDSHCHIVVAHWYGASLPGIARNGVLFAESWIEVAA